MRGVSSTRLVPSTSTRSAEALGLLRAALPPGHFATSVAECRVGEALAGQGRPDEARPFLERGSEALLEAGRREAERDRVECANALRGL